MVSDSGLDLRQLRTFVTVAERGSFTRAAEDLQIAQQAVSQQIKALEGSLGVTLLHRTSRHVELTAEGAVFLADSRRVLAAAERAASRVRAATRGEAGVLRLAFTLTTAWDTIPQLLSRLGELYPEITVEAREVFGADIRELLLSEQCDLVLAPMTPYPRGFHSQTIRRESMRVAVSDSDPIAVGQSLELAALRDRRFELWPRAMAPGFYDAVIGACHAAGFDPTIDEHARGNTVWGYLAKGRGVALINDSLREQLPRGVSLVELASEAPLLTITGVWTQDVAVIRQTLKVARQLATERGWLSARLTATHSREYAGSPRDGV